ncbi:hypothetical protein INR49_025258 [Caranx melampygus]|nr:hypothetical protein INR49_025258 [Caranx melampygus]
MHGLQTDFSLKKETELREEQFLSLTVVQQQQQQQQQQQREVLQRMEHRHRQILKMYFKMQDCARHNPTLLSEQEEEKEKKIPAD